MSKKIDLQSIKQQLINVQNEINQIIGGIDGALGIAPSTAFEKARGSGMQSDENGMRVIEGVFDGVGMIGPDGKQYSVPANYASKSKLVEGDMLKLSIQPDGTFVFKQIGPVERDRIVGVLAYDDHTRQYYGVVQNKSYGLLTASVTYYKGEVGDEVILLVPQGGDSNSAAVENIVKQHPVNESAQKYIPSTEEQTTVLTPASDQGMSDEQTFEPVAEVTDEIPAPVAPTAPVTDVLEQIPVTPASMPITSPSSSNDEPPIPIMPPLATPSVKPAPGFEQAAPEPVASASVPGQPQPVFDEDVDEFRIE